VASHARERIARDIRARLAEIFAVKVADPRLRGVTIAEVRPSPDVSFAKVLYRTLGDPAEIGDAIERAKPFVRHCLAEGWKLRRVPELAFIHDTSPDRAERIEQILREVGAGDEPGEPA
jgi:ribosome-binding factor A